jgi:sugar lactone lactonase YvrE
LQVVLHEPVGVAVDIRGRLYLSSGQQVLWINDEGLLAPFAGSGKRGFSGDGGPALQAELNDPYGLAVDAKGNVYIASAGSGRVRKVTRDGLITTVAGGGSRKALSGPARNLQLNNPLDLLLDPRGDLYIADSGDHVVRRVTPDGWMTTVAGTGREGFSGDGGPATQARLNWPVGIAMDAKGRLYIADKENHRVREVATSGIIRTIAGTGEIGTSGDGGSALKARLNGPHEVSVDGAGNVYILGMGIHRVRRMDPSGFIRPFAGTGSMGDRGEGGEAVRAELNEPHDMALDPSGDLFIADTFNGRIRKVSVQGRIITVVGSGQNEEETSASGVESP